MLHLILDLSVASLFVPSSVGVHLVDTDTQLTHTEKVEQTSMLASLALNLIGLMVTLLDRSGEVTICRNHEQAHISLSCTRNHILDEVTMAWSINDGVMPVVCEELLGGARDGDTTLTLLLLTVHVESEGERSLAEMARLLLQLLQLTLGKAAELENEAAGSGGLAGIDMATNDDGEMLQIAKAVRKLRLNANIRRVRGQPASTVEPHIKNALCLSYCTYKDVSMLKQASPSVGVRANTCVGTFRILFVIITTHAAVTKLNPARAFAMKHACFYLVT